MLIEGKKRILLIAGILLITASIIWYANYRLNFSGFFWNDSHDYNQIARNIYKGEGFKTSTLRPVNFLHFKKLPHPELSRPPLYPHMVAGSFMLFGVNDFAVVVCDGVFYAILVVLTFLVAVELSRSYPIALFSALMVAFSKYFLYMSILGSSDIVYAGFFMCFLFLYLKKQKSVFWLGLVAGILYLFRVNTVFFIIPWLLVEFGKNSFRRWRELGIFAMGGFVAVLPYLLRNYLVTGNPLFSLHKYSLILQTKAYPGWTAWIQTKDLSAVQFLLAHPDEILNKVQNSISFLYRDFVNAFHPAVILLLSLSFILPLRINDERIKKLRICVLWALIIQTLATLPIGPEVRFYLYLFPMIFILFGIVCYEMLKRMTIIRKEWLPGIILIAVSLLIVFPSISYFRNNKKINIYAILGEKIKTITTPNDIIASDMAWGISWYADRKAVWLPYDLETMDEISRFIPINYVFLTIDLGSPLAYYKDHIWQKLFFNANTFKISGLTLAAVFYMNDTPVGVLYKFDKNHT